MRWGVYPKVSVTRDAFRTRLYRLPSMLRSREIHRARIFSAFSPIIRIHTQNISSVAPKRGVCVVNVLEYNIIFWSNLPVPCTGRFVRKRVVLVDCVDFSRLPEILYTSCAPINLSHKFNISIIHIGRTRKIL